MSRSEEMAGGCGRTSWSTQESLKECHLKILPLLELPRKATKHDNLFCQQRPPDTGHSQAPGQAQRAAIRNIYNGAVTAEEWSRGQGLFNKDLPSVRLSSRPRHRWMLQEASCAPKGPKVSWELILMSLSQGLGLGL